MSGIVRKDEAEKEDQERKWDNKKVGFYLRQK